MEIKRTIIWAIVALVVGVALGFGFRTPLANILNLEAQGTGFAPWGTKEQCVPPKIWTGNGCADTNSWTAADWRYFWNCLRNGQSQEVCAGKTEAGKGRKN
ncbi:MAG: hypothetical protein Q7K33_02805 [Candidatus Berkelbacteria bacterium]|nr:hypothetical protein [Candidatus Berkelbacteria bacterium]